MSYEQGAISNASTEPCTVRNPINALATVPGTRVLVGQYSSVFIQLVPDTVSVRGLDTVVITNSIVRGRISDYILIANRRYD